MQKLALFILLATGLAQAAPPPWNNPQRHTELRQEMRQPDKAVKAPLKETVESHYLMRNPEEREQYLSRRMIVAKPSQAKVPLRSARDHDPDTGTYYYVPTTP